MRKLRRSDFGRRPGKPRETKRLFVLYCEGENTEPDYFYALERFVKSRLLEIEYDSPAGVPFTIAEKAVERAKQMGLRRGRSSFEEGDQVWAVFDRDEHPRFDEAVTLCEQSGVNVARSDPCFEVWLILHHEDCHRPLTRHEAQKRLQQLCPEYNRNGAKTVDCAKLIARIDDAEGRAEKHLASRASEGNAFGASSTTVHLLTKAIRGKA